MSGPNNDWLHFYNNQNFPTQSIPTSTTTATTVAATAPSSPPLRTMTIISTSPSSSSQHLSPDQGRVSKPTRRRSRASRRTPTTLLNTDTTNFRAMVQQFTGGPTGPFAPTTASSSGFPNLLGFGVLSSVNPSSTLMAPPPLSGYNILHQHQHPFQPQNQPNIYDVGGGSGDNTIIRRLSHPTRAAPHDHDAILMDHGHGGGRFFPNTSSS